MIHPDELAICRKRGHSLTHLTDGWTPCPHCGMWVREVKTVTVEERETEPPEDELDPLFAAKRDMDVVDNLLKSRKLLDEPEDGSMDAV